MWTFQWVYLTCINLLYTRGIIDGSASKTRFLFTSFESGQVPLFMVRKVFSEMVLCSKWRELMIVVGLNTVRRYPIIHGNTRSKCDRTDSWNKSSKQVIQNCAQLIQPRDRYRQISSEHSRVHLLPPSWLDRRP